MGQTTFLLKFANVIEDIPLKELKHPIRIASLRLYSALILSRTEKFKFSAIGGLICDRSGKVKERR
jgi:hypothetical protein